MDRAIRVRLPRRSLSRCRRLIAALLACGVAMAAVGAAEAARPKSSRGRSKSPPPRLVWYAENLEGHTVASEGADKPINPASVVKVATTWWALLKLGPEYRFDTRFAAAGRIDPESGVLHGDLVVVGGGDPDFHAENALLVAEALNGLGVKSVTGSLVVRGAFWIGWEHGAGGVQPDGDRRGRVMAARLRRALDPSRWGRAERDAWQRYVRRGGGSASRPPRIAVAGESRFESGADPSVDDTLLVHRSKPIVEILRRFNCYSNNDIERIGDQLGSPSDLSSFLAATVGGADPAIRLASTSGLGENRLTLRQIVAMLRSFRESARALGLDVESLLPVAGCDPGTVTRFFPRLATGENATSLVGKTGTLVTTDGGVSVIAGFVNTAEGEVVFAVAAPRAGGRLRAARGAEERWILDLIAKQGGPRPRSCAPPLASAETGVELLYETVVSEAGPERHGRATEVVRGGRSSD